MNLRTMRSTEHNIQSALFSWAQLQSVCYPELALMFAIPNGGKREKLQDKKGRWFSPTAQKLKREGVKPGVPDIFLPCARGGAYGSFIEMKAPDGRTTAVGYGTRSSWLLRLSSRQERSTLSRSR